MTPKRLLLPIVMLFLLGYAGLALASPEAAPVSSSASAIEAGADYIAHEERGLLTAKWQEMLWTVVVFVLFFAVLSTLVWPKILGGLQAREDKQRTDLLEAQNARQDAQQTLEKYQAELADARKASQKILDDARDQARQLAAQLKAEAEADLTSMKDKAHAQIHQAKEQALNDIYAQTATLATDVAGRILQRELNPDDQKALVEASLAQYRTAHN